MSPGKLASVLTFNLVQKIGYIIPITLFASVFLSTGTGLLSLLQPDTSTARWVGFQILVGVGFGAGLQMVCVLAQQHTSTTA